MAKDNNVDDSVNIDDSDVDCIGSAMFEGPFEDVIISIGMLDCVAVNVDDSEDIDDSDVDCIGNAVVEASLEITISVGVEDWVDVNVDSEDIWDSVVDSAADSSLGDVIIST